jgi:hypothetical protein
VDLDDKVTFELSTAFTYNHCEDQSGDFMQAAQELPLYRLITDIQFDFASRNAADAFDFIRRGLLAKVNQKDSKTKDLV